MLVDGKEVFYFATGLIHSITQNIKESSSIRVKKTEVEFECADFETFTDLLSELMYQTIQLNHGPESRVGKLVSFNASMLVILHEEDGLIYYNIEHVKFIKVALEDNEERSKKSFNSSYSSFGNHKHFIQFQPLDGFNDMQMQVESESFSDFIYTFKHKWVSINRTGPEALEGVLIDEGCGFLTIVNNEEAYRIHPFHIKSISVGAKGSFKSSKENKDEDGKDKEQSDDDASSSYEESSYRESCSCEESFVYEESVEEVTWSPKHHVKTYDVFN